jgi:aspartate/methionine/tyrosine aminotransferase
MREQFGRRRDRIKQKLSEMEDVECLTPHGAFYVFPDFSAYGLSSLALAELILKKTGVVTAAGSIFSEDASSHLRFSYATSMEIIEEGLDKLAEFLPMIK